jgi:hypothetical protein
MKERLTSLMLAGAALACFYALFLPHARAPTQKVTRPLSTEAGPNGYLGLTKWLQAEGRVPWSLRQRYGRLDELTRSQDTGNLLIATTPQLYPIRQSEVEPLQAWIERGNTLLVLAGLSDTPDWSMGEGVDTGFLYHLRLMTSLGVAQIVPEKQGDGGSQQSADAKSRARAAAAALAKLATPEQIEILARAPHPLMQGVSALADTSEYPSAKWKIATSEGPVLELAYERQTQAPALWLLRYGDGKIIVSAFANLFTNKVIGQRDNAQLLANIVNTSTAAGGHVILDDAHQGLVAFYDPTAFFGDKRLHSTLWLLLLLWLVFVVSSQPLRSQHVRWEPLDVGAFVRATGGFMARVLTPAAAARRLFENFFADIRRAVGMTHSEIPWEWLHSQAQLPSAQLEEMQALYSRAHAGGKLDVVRLQNLLTEARSLLL